MVGLLVCVVVLLGLILVTLWAVLYQLVKQQGRLLLRQDDLESRLVRIGPNLASNGAAMAGARAQPAGLPVGTPLPPFRLSNLEGRVVDSEDLRGKRVLLIHWSPSCGYCARIAPDLARLQSELRAQGIAVLLVAHGDAASNEKLAKEHELNFPILLLAAGEAVPEAFQSHGTPVAYLLDDEGRVAKPLAVGYEHVMALAREAAGVGWKRTRLPSEKPLSQSKLIRDGLKAGTFAPTFSLPDLNGGMLTLQEYRGRRVLLVFSDPHCGPCDQLAAELGRLHRTNGDTDLTLIMVGRGDPEENRLKAREHGIDFPVVLQRRWELSKEYGIFATPVAFLINEHGVISRNVAKGVDEILALTTEGLTPGRR